MDQKRNDPTCSLALNIRHFMEKLLLHSAKSIRFCRYHGSARSASLFLLRFTICVKNDIIVAGL
jgi:hypothetical protein